MSILESLKKLVNLNGTNVIHKAAVEKILDMTFKNLEKEVLPSFLELSKANPKVFNPGISAVLQSVTKQKGGNDQAKYFINVIKDLQKNEEAIRKAVKDLPEHIPTKFITSKKASTLSIVSTVGSFALCSLDIAILMVSDADGNDFSPSITTQMNNSLAGIGPILEFIKNVKTHIQSLDKTDDEININDDNIRLESILKSNGGLPDIPNLNFSFIGKVAYNIGTWLVDREMKKYDSLKLKKQYLLKRLLEIEGKLSNSPEDVKLKKAKEVYVNEIEKTNYAILKIETI